MEKEVVYVKKLRLTQELQELYQYKKTASESYTYGQTNPKHVL